MSDKCFGFFLHHFIGCLTQTFLFFHKKTQACVRFIAIYVQMAEIIGISLYLNLVSFVQEERILYIPVYQEYSCCERIDYCRIYVEIVAKLTFLCINSIYAII